MGLLIGGDNRSNGRIQDPMGTRPVDLKFGQVLCPGAGSNYKLDAASELRCRSGMRATSGESRCVSQPGLDPGSCAGGDIQGLANDRCGIWVRVWIMYPRRGLLSLTDSVR